MGGGGSEGCEGCEGLVHRLWSVGCNAELGLAGSVIMMIPPLSQH